ncbi:MAG: F0F1 ATP synthase subunit alpha, partial [Caulobacterales bacterium]|nr:F0F1 ATP synthase subunit alpha [Caulobacterales bacterium]
FAGTRGYLDGLEVGDVKRFEEGLLQYLNSERSDVLELIRERKYLRNKKTQDTEPEDKLKAAVEDYAKSFA